MAIKVLHLSSFDISGGAARAAYRIHQGLQRAGVDSRMLVQHKSGSDRAVTTAERKLLTRLRSSLDSAPLSFYRQRQHAVFPQFFSPEWVPDSIIRGVDQINPDIINLNWVCNGYLQVESLTRLNKPLIWTLQDMWAFTGGCHYSLGCDRYKRSCGSCPQLNSSTNRDLSHWIWQRKAKAQKDLNLTIVAPSSWMAECVTASSLFQHLPVEVIPFGLDTAVFEPVPPQIARTILHLPQDKQLILFGAIDAIHDTRKGFHLLQAALQQLNQLEWKNRIELVIFGSPHPEQSVDLGFQCHYLGRLQDDTSLKLAYSAANVMIAPSIEEAFGQTASESLACGTPVVVFNDTGLKDIVDHQQNGYVSQYCNVEDLARGIAWVLENEERQKFLRANARQKAEREFSLEIQARRYLALFDRILDRGESQLALAEGCSGPRPR